MKQNAKCYICVYCQECDKVQELRCRNMNYALFTTEEQKRMCDLMGCGEVEEDES